MKTVEPHLAADAIACLDHRQNVRCVLAECFRHEVDIASKLVMADKRRSKRVTESETFVEDDRYESLICAGNSLFELSEPPWRGKYGRGLETRGAAGQWRRRLLNFGE
jgi:hypothetical protein